MKASTKATRLENLRVALGKIRLTCSKVPGAAEHVDFLDNAIAEQVRELQTMRADARVERLPNRSDVRFENARKQNVAKDFPPVSPLRNYFSYTHTSPSNMRARENFSESSSVECSQEQDKSYHDEVLNDPQVIALIASQLQVGIDAVYPLLEKFSRENLITQNFHESRQDYRKHFLSYARIAQQAEQRAVLAEKRAARQSNRSYLSRSEERELQREKRRQEFIARMTAEAATL